MRVIQKEQTTQEKIDDILAGNVCRLKPAIPMSFSDYRLFRIAALIGSKPDWSKWQEFSEFGCDRLSFEEYAAATGRTLVTEEKKKNYVAVSNTPLIMKDEILEEFRSAAMVMQHLGKNALSEGMATDVCQLLTLLFVPDQLLLYPNDVNKVEFFNYFANSAHRSEYFMNDLASIPAMRLYDILVKHASRHTLNIKLPVLGKTFCLQPEQAKWKTLKPILDECVGKINRYTDLTVEYSELCDKARPGRPVEGVSFHIACGAYNVQMSPEKQDAELYSAIFPFCRSVCIYKSQDIRDVAKFAVEAVSTPEGRGNALDEKIRALSNIRCLIDALKRGVTVKNRTAWLCAAIRDNYAAKSVSPQSKPQSTKRR